MVDLLEMKETELCAINQRMSTKKTPQMHFIAIQNNNISVNQIM